MTPRPRGDAGLMITVQIETDPIATIQAVAARAKPDPAAGKGVEPPKGAAFRRTPLIQASWIETPKESSRGSSRPDSRRTS